MILIDDKLLWQTINKAKNNERLRQNFNLHSSLEEPVQKLLNALELNTKIPIHRHRDVAETYILIKGSIKVVFYDDNKKRTYEVVLNPLKGVYGIDIPKNQWHSIEVLESGSVIFEVKEGPYRRITEEDILR